jgi:hypothetical protein
MPRNLNDCTNVRSWIRLLYSTSLRHILGKNFLYGVSHSWSRILELTISLRFLSIILRVLRLEVSVYNVYITNEFQTTFAQGGGGDTRCWRCLEIARRKSFKLLSLLLPRIRLLLRRILQILIYTEVILRKYSGSCWAKSSYLTTKCLLFRGSEKNPQRRICVVFVQQRSLLEASRVHHPTRRSHTCTHRPTRRSHTCTTHVPY